MSKPLILTILFALCFGLFLFPQATAQTIDGDCRGTSVDDEPTLGGMPSAGGLACLSFRVECIEDENGSVCRAAAGVITRVGPGSCWRTAGHLPSPAAEACDDAASSAASAVGTTECFEGTAIGDEKAQPGFFVRARDHDEGPDVIGFAGGCGEAEGYCNVFYTTETQPRIDCQQT